MAVRQIIPIDRVVKCHVNSVDGSPTYESGVAYAAGTLVILDDTVYTAIKDITDDDTDTPDEAPDRWAITPNAFREGSGGDGGLTARVTALENALDTTKVLVSTGLCEVTADTDTGASICEKLVTAMNEIIAALEDNETLEIVKLEGAYTGVPLNRYTYTNTNPIASLNVIGGAFTDSWGTTVINLIHLAAEATDVKWLRTDLKATPIYNTDYAVLNFTDGYKMAFRYHVYKTINVS